MTETANILAKATSRSLVIPMKLTRDEHLDGLSIAWAVVEHIHNSIRCRTLFATHYHELTSLTNTLERVENHHIAVREHRDEIIFLHKLVPGGTNRSYGIQVGLAGLHEVVDRAKVILRQLESEPEGQEHCPVLLGGGGNQLALFQSRPRNRPRRRLSEALISIS